MDMEKLSVDMDLDDWEFLDFNHHVHGGKKKEKGFDPKGVIRPFPSSRHIDIASSENPSVISPVPIELEQVVKKKKGQELELEISKVRFIDIGVVSPVNKDPDTVSRVFFKKNEFVDMKMDSPRGLKLLTEAGSVKFEDKEDEYKTISEVKNDQDMVKTAKKKQEDNWEGSLDIWGWKVNGVGALCCVGVAAATTICIFIFGSRRGNKENRNQKIQFHIHSDKEKRSKQGVHEHIWTQAIAAAKGVPLDGAQMLFGGY